MRADFRKFELKTSLGPSGGAQATAYLRQYDPVTKGDVTDYDTTFRVWDHNGDREGIGRDDSTPDHGAYGLAMRITSEPDRTRVWMIIDLECP